MAKVIVCLLTSLMLGQPIVLAASDYFGQVTFNGSRFLELW